MVAILTILTTSIFLATIPMAQAAVSINQASKTLPCAAKFMYSYSNLSKKCYIAVMKEHCSNSKADRNDFHPRNIHHCPHIRQSLQQSESLKKIKWKKTANIIASCLGLVGQKKRLLEKYKRKCNE